MFHNFNVNLRKNKGFLTYMSYIPIPEYGQSNPPQISMLYSPIYAVVQFSLETRYYFVSCPLHPDVEPFSGRVRPLLNKVMGFHRPFRSRGLGTSKFYFLLLIVVWSSGLMLIPLTPVLPHVMSCLCFTQIHSRSSCFEARSCGKPDLLRIN